MTSHITEVQTVCMHITEDGMELDGAPVSQRVVELWESLQVELNKI
jgi:hypothetical protein